MGSIFDSVLVDRTDLGGPVRHWPVNRGGDLRLGQVPDRIVIHRNTASKLWRLHNPYWVGSDLEALVAWFRDPSNRWRSRIFPYHAFVDRDGKSYRIHRNAVVSPHARGFNRRGVGVCLNLDGRVEIPSAEIWAGAVEVTRQYLRECPGAQVIRHSRLKQCPGRNVDVKALAAEAAEGN